MNLHGIRYFYRLVRNNWRFGRCQHGICARCVF